MGALAAEHLLPGVGDDIELGPIEPLGESRRGGVADGEAGPVSRYPVAIGNLHARRGAVPGEDHIMVEIHGGEIGDVAIARGDDADVLQLELLDHIGDPALAEAFPGQHVDATRAKQRPHGHFDCAGVGGGHDTDEIISGDLQDFAREVDGQLQLHLSDLGAVRAAQRRIGEILEAVARTLGAGSGGEIGIGGTHRRMRYCHFGPSFQMGAARWGAGSRTGDTLTQPRPSSVLSPRKKAGDARLFNWLCAGRRQGDQSIM